MGLQMWRGDSAATAVETSPETLRMIAVPCLPCHGVNNWLDIQAVQVYSYAIATNKRSPYT